MNISEKYVVCGYSLESIRNRNEFRVAEQLRQLLPKEEDFCGCRICVEDVYAAALSQLPVQYVQVGSIVVQPGAAAGDITQAVQTAIGRIRANPNHSAPSKTAGG